MKKNITMEQSKTNNNVATPTVLTTVPPTIKTVLKAVHVDLIDIQRRARNVLVSGLKLCDSESDSDLFQKLCFDHLGLNINAPFCRRLGKVKDSKTQLLLEPYKMKKLHNPL